MNLLTQLSQLKGKTISRVLFDGSSIIALAFKDGDIAVVKASCPEWSGVELEFATTVDCLSDYTQLRLGIIDATEFHRRGVEWDRRLAETLAWLNEKYEG